MCLFKVMNFSPCLRKVFVSMRRTITFKEKNRMARNLICGHIYSNDSSSSKMPNIVQFHLGQPPKCPVFFENVQLVKMVYN